MSRVDSGNESQEGSPDTTASEPALLHTPPRLSAVLTQGKVVIRPVAFKPSTLSSSRFSSYGQRYGSTPILARPNSHLALYGSTNELWREKTVSPMLAMSSLPSDCGRLHSYDSLESVYKASVTQSNRGERCGDSVSELTPSPCDSLAVAELEGVLRDRDSELQYLRQTMEHNEKVIFRVYEEKEKQWEREMKRLKALHETRLRTSAQRALKLEQMLMMHTYQLQEDKKRLKDDLDRTEEDKESIRRELELLRGRLEETEWGLCQKSGELALLKSKLKDTQNENSTKVQEILSLKVEIRELKASVEKRDEEIEMLSMDLKDSNNRLYRLGRETQHESFKIKLEDCPEEKIEKSQSVENINDQLLELNELKEQLAKERADWDKERSKWAEEKGKVLDYQKQLQVNYVQMYRRTKELEKETENLKQKLHNNNTLPSISQRGINL